MLKPADIPPGPRERPIGELLGQLVDDGKAYARAELDLAKAIAEAKTRAVAVSAIILVVALFIAMAALNALSVGIVLSLSHLMGPLLAGIVAFVLIGVVASLFAWWGVAKLRRSL